MDNYIVSGRVVDNQSGEIVAAEGQVIDSVDAANRVLGYINRLRVPGQNFTYDVHQAEGEPDAQVTVNRVSMELVIYIVRNLMERGTTPWWSGQDVIDLIEKNFAERWGQPLNEKGA